MRVREEISELPRAEVLSEEKIVCTLLEYALRIEKFVYGPQIKFDIPSTAAFLCSHHVPV